MNTPQRQDFTFDSSKAAQENQQPNVLAQQIGETAVKSSKVIQESQPDSVLKEVNKQVTEKVKSEEKIPETPANQILKQEPNKDIKKESPANLSTADAMTKPAAKKHVDEQKEDGNKMEREQLKTPLVNLGERNEDSIRSLCNLLTWENKIRSGCVMMLGLVGFYVVWLWFYSYDKNLCALICDILLFLLGFNFVGSIFSMKWNKKFGNMESSLTSATLTLLASSFAQLLTQLYDNFLNAESSWITLYVLLLVWGLQQLGNNIGIFPLSLLCYFAMFSLPVLCKEYQQVISEQRGKMSKFMKDLRWRLQLTRMHLLSFLTVVVAFGWPFSTMETQATMLLTLMVVIKCQLKPEEISMFEAKLSETFTPFLQSVQKSVAKVVQAAQDEGIIPTPTPSKISPIGVHSQRILFSDSPELTEKKAA